MLRLICLAVSAFAVVTACGSSDDANKVSSTATGGTQAATGSPAATTVPGTAAATAGPTGNSESAAFQAYRASVTGLYDAAANPVPQAVTTAMGGCNDLQGTKDVYHLVNDCSTVAQSVARDLGVTAAVQQSLQLQHDFMLSQIDALVALSRTPGSLADIVKAQVTNAPIWHPALTMPSPAAS